MRTRGNGRGQMDDAGGMHKRAHSYCASLQEGEEEWGERASQALMRSWLTRVNGGVQCLQTPQQAARNHRTRGQRMAFL